MTLPTIQPFDFPDWGAPGTVTSAFYNFAVIAAPGNVVDLNVGYYNHTLLIFDGNGDGASYTVQLKWYNANPLEGGNLIYTQQVTVANTCLVAVPMTNPTTFLRIDDVLSTTYPHNVLLTVTQFAQWGSMVGYPGGEMVLFLLTGTSGPETLVWTPAGCSPGLHQIRVTTVNPSWDLYLRNWYDANNSQDVLLATDATPEPFVFDFIAPANSWQLVFVSGDAGDWDVSPLVTRLPT